MRRPKAAAGGGEQITAANAMITKKAPIFRMIRHSKWRAPVNAERRDLVPALVTCRGFARRSSRSVTDTESFNDRLDDLARMRDDRDNEGVLVRLRFLERLELAVEERRRHEMSGSRRDAPLDKVAVA